MRCTGWPAWSLAKRVGSKTQRHQQSCGQWLATAGVDSFAVYIIHPLIVVVVMGLISLTEWPNFAALVLGGVASVLVSFGLSHQLRRVPLLARVI